MHVKSALIAVAASSAAFYTIGRYGSEIRWPEAPSPAVQQALAQPEKSPEPAQPAMPEPAQAETEFAQAATAPGRPGPSTPARPS